MAWAHSHTLKAYDNARANLEAWSKRRLAQALANIEGNRGARFYRTLPHDVLVDACMDAIDSTNLCDNGGGAFWIDPEGYETVSCSKEDR